MTATDAPTTPHLDPPTVRLPGEPATGQEQRAEPDSGGPGRTRFTDGAVTTIATRAVAEVDQVGGAARRVLGVPVGADDADRSPRVDARVDGTVVTLEVRLSVTYPAPVGRVTRAVRAHVIERVATLTGLDVARVDITVEALNAPVAPTRTLA